MWRGLCVDEYSVSRLVLEMCSMEMGKIGITLVPWYSHVNGNMISYGMGLKCVGMEIKTWVWAKRLHTVTRTVNSLLFMYTATWSYHSTVALEPETGCSFLPV